MLSQTGTIKVLVRIRVSQLEMVIRLYPVQRASRNYPETMPEVLAAILLNPFPRKPEVVRMRLVDEDAPACQAKRTGPAGLLTMQPM